MANQDFASLEIEDAWVAEIERRLTAFHRGEIEAIDAHAALEQIRKRWG